jgi:hypothetical protein
MDAGETKDLRKIDLKNYEDKKYLDNLFIQFITMDEDELLKVIPDYDKYEAYYDM